MPDKKLLGIFFDYILTNAKVCVLQPNAYNADKFLWYSLLSLFNNDHHPATQCFAWIVISSVIV
jgi:hypothetical protein